MIAFASVFAREWSL